MLEKGKGISRDEFIHILMDKKDKGNDAILITMNGDFYGKIITVGLDKVSINQEGKIITIDIDSILEVQ